MNSHPRRLGFESLEDRHVFAAGPFPDTVLHDFAGPTADGASPLGSLTLVGDVLYGTTSSGGASDMGTLFQIDRDGTDYTILHEFAGLDGRLPQHGALLRDGTKLYGTTLAGGLLDSGVIFSYDTALPSNSAYSVIHTFNGLDGALPQGGLTLVGTTLYGVTTAGGLLGQGTLFKIDVSGNPLTFASLASFGLLNGSHPVGAPVFLNNHLYGTTTTGGLFGVGTIYDYNFLTLGTVHTFAGGASDGASPGNGALTAIGNLLYGTTTAGGTDNLGTLFSFNPTGSVVSVLRSFAGGATDGEIPQGSLSAQGTILYGTTSEGGPADAGTAYSFDTADASYDILHFFGGGTTDGANPADGVVYLAQPGRVTLYGLTTHGGADGFGTIYSVQVPVADPNAISVTSADYQGSPQVTVYNDDGTLRFKFMAYSKSFLGGVRVAVGDVNGDGTPDIITAGGPGKRQAVRVFSGVDGTRFAQFYASNKYFSGGLFVAAGNFDADAKAEVVVSFGSGGTGAVQTFNIDATITVFPGPLGLFYPYGKSKSGVQVATGNIDGVGTDELIVAPGWGGNSLVAVYNASGTLINSFTAYGKPFTGGVFVAAGDLNGDGKAEIVTGPMQTNTSQLRVFNGQTGVMQSEALIYGNNFFGGLRVAIADRNQDGIGEIMTAPGILGNQNVLTLDGTTLAVLDSFFAGYPGIRKIRGVFVAGSRSF
jgi:uncharacterized repeat protein (TIGR03803 family)